mmetsp:Transcript_12926/g.29752  ORF Transcript_12926/g.29752 Transcript_12926/m.29752 type:complete len:615 (-) Transcript_12926:243-2087(-)|eukprot:CAMPEP_0114556470 /NCGR_PEP_ID=MMETSP0114-20121206/9308_1 /TAXON_ID=31324 /ORGANISM="Goniomonas sp, Strain m" /LENGTH=614 /DNA_ID=CAMNT_0001741681 /DNA_START=78 /DNA_END=1922 /DNA_ORIENTATION=-
MAASLARLSLPLSPRPASSSCSPSAANRLMQHSVNIQVNLADEVPDWRGRALVVSHEPPSIELSIMSRGEEFTRVLSPPGERMEKDGDGNLSVTWGPRGFSATLMTVSQGVLRVRLLRKKHFRAHAIGEVNIPLKDARADHTPYNLTRVKQGLKQDRGKIWLAVRSGDSFQEASSRPAKFGPSSFERLKKLGQGDVGRVYLARLAGSDELFGMKILSKEEMVARNKIQRCANERDVLSTMTHPFVVTLHSSFESTEFVYFVMDFCAGGEFFRLLRTQPDRRIPEPWVKFYSREVLLALEYLHSLGFVYRDLKPENILVHATGHVMLTDFDLAKRGAVTKEAVMARSGGEPILNSISFVGTEEYLAPEVISGQVQTGALDWWTFGILVYEMTFGSTPFKGNSQQDTFEHISNKVFQITIPDKPPISSGLAKLIKKLLTREATKRMGSKDLKKSEFYEGTNWELVLDYEPPFVPPLEAPHDTRHFQHIDDDIDPVLDAQVPWAPGFGPPGAERPVSVPQEQHPQEQQQPQYQQQPQFQQPQQPQPQQQQFRSASPSNGVAELQLVDSGSPRPSTHSPQQQQQGEGFTDPFSVDADPFSVFGGFQVQPGVGMVPRPS